MEVNLKEEFQVTTAASIACRYRLGLAPKSTPKTPPTGREVEPSQATLVTIPKNPYISTSWA